MKAKRTFLEKAARIIGIIMASAIGITCVVCLIICIIDLIKQIVQ